MPEGRPALTGDRPRAAVTGASGFAGTDLCRALAEAGWETVALDRFPPAAPLPVSRFVEADVRDGWALAGAFEGADVVFHLAAIPSIARLPEATYFDVNAAGTDLVLRMARRAGVRKVVHVSSSTVYGVPESCPVPEDHPLRPTCPYSRSKLAAEEHCQRHAQDGLDVTILRPRVVVGPGRAGVFALLFTLLDLHLPVPLPAHGRTRFQFTAVSDLSRAALLAAGASHPGRARVYNVGARVEAPLGDDLRRLRAHAGSRSPFFPLPEGAGVRALHALHRTGLLPLVPEQIQVLGIDFVLDTSRIARDLGFEPAAENAAGLLAAYDWWRAHRGPSRPADVLRFWKLRHQNLLQERR